MGKGAEDLQFMALHFALIVLALVMMFIGAEGLVRGSSSLALRMGVSALVVGLTVVSFGTSAPELLVSLKSTSIGQADIAVGNVVGSNLFNMGVILGLTALICPIPVRLKLLRADLPVMVLACMIMPLLLLDEVIGRVEGGLLFAGVVIYTVANIFMARKESDREVISEFEEAIPVRSGSAWMDVLIMMGGLAMLAFGSDLLVEHAVVVARAWGISEAVIGLTIIATGTSMPELVTSVVAALKKEPDIAIGNVVGSSIYNVMLILGLSSLVMPMESGGITFIDYGFMIGLSLLLVPMLYTGMRLRQSEGLLLLAGYGCYLYLLWPK
jgi:cation:H+ antiporter